VLDATSPGDVIKGVIAQLTNIQYLIDAGATQFLIPNLPPLGSTPLFNGSPADGVAATAVPDTYLFWDDLHPTSRGHNIVAVTAPGAFNAVTCGLPCSK
jgi:phospholipase/lecithinase/hemolysin